MPTCWRRVLILAVSGLSIAACGGEDSGFTLGAEARLTIDPTVISFGDVARGEQAFRVVEVRHSGTSGTIILDPIRLDSPSQDLSLGEVQQTRLEPGESTYIQVVYSSDHDDPDIGDLVIGHNLAENPSTTIPVTTPGQRAQLIAQPGVVDFGIVQAGNPKEVLVDIINVGSAPATFTGCAVEDDEDADFACTLGSTTVVGPEERASIILTYKPSGRDADTGIARLKTDRDDVQVTIPMEGQEETPILVVEPSVVQFGWVEPGDKRLVGIKIRNEGNVGLDLESIELTDAHPKISLVGSVALPQTLEPEDAVELGVQFAPDDDVPMAAKPLATLIIRSNDEANDPYDVPLFGAAGTPGIIVVPEDVVDFGYVAEGFEGTRAVSVINVGDSAVTVTGAQLLDETTDEFSFPDAGKLPKQLNPGQSVDLELKFDNREGDSGTEFAQFQLATTDPLVPVYPMDVVARRAERPTCEPSFVPEILAMGATPEGATMDGSLLIANYGSGNCEYREYEIDGCLKVQTGARHRFNCSIQGLNTPFEVISAPPYGTVLGPGETAELQIRFTAPSVVNLEIGRDSYFGRVAAIMHDPNLNTFAYVAPEGGWMKGINLRAESAIPLVTVQPEVLNYGLVRTDCESNANLVRVTNTGPLAATITGIEAVGCDGEVNVAAPSLPVTVEGFQTAYIETFYGPDDAGETLCEVRVTTDAVISNWGDAKVANIPAKGEGIDVTHNIDTFEQVPPPKVDVLFVVDDSGSMADEQQLLKKELPKLVQLAIGWGQDYHLAATTTDVISVKGQFKGSPPFATTEHTAADFADNLVVGITGYYLEQGLEASWMALQGPNTITSDQECINAPGQCPLFDPDNNKYMWCLEGYCRGPNWGFLRDDAELVIIMISDEEDSSPESVQWYVSNLSALKPPNSGVGVKIHGIIYPPEGCFSGFGNVGYRYIEAIKATNGVQASICATDFTAEFQAISESTFGLNDRFYPTLPPDAATLTVSINGVQCSSGWQWNAATGSVILDEDGACWADYGDTVELEYDVACVSSGN